MLIIGLTVALAAMVFGVVTNFVQDETEGAYECFETMGNVLISSEYTCYNSNELKIAIQVKDLNITKLLISISDEDNSKTIELTQSPQTLDYFSENAKVPNANSQSIYYFDYSSAGLSTPTSMRIAPFSGNRQCEASDEISSINQC